MAKVKKVSAEIVRPLRHKVLRPSLPFKSSIMDLDDHDYTFHFCVKEEFRIISVASVYHESFVEMPKKDAYRLRGMATEPSEQGKGYGKMVLNDVIAYLSKETESEILWCNARTTAFGFYEKMGFNIVGNEFDIPNLGPHKKGFIHL